jgi:SHAQKYF class myb-like DNA-binding protein
MIIHKVRLGVLIHCHRSKHKLEIDEFHGMTAVATPKQIRELMKVDGLTNDEVKSHLQVSNSSKSFNPPKEHSFSSSCCCDL